MTTTVIGGTGQTGAHKATRMSGRGQSKPEAERDAIRTSSPSRQPAVRGADAAYVAYAPGLAFPGAAEQVSDLAALAARVGCGRIVLLSGRGEPAALEAEKVVLDSGADVTVLRCAVFAQNFSESFLLRDDLAGAIVLPVGEVAEPFVDADDIADAAVVALHEPGHAGQVYDLTGSELVTFADAARTLAAALRHEITYTSMAVDEYRAVLPPDVCGELADLFGYLFDGHNATTSDGVREILGRAPRRFADYVHATAGTGVWSAR